MAIKNLVALRHSKSNNQTQRDKMKRILASHQVLVKGKKPLKTKPKIAEIQIAIAKS